MGARSAGMRPVALIFIAVTLLIWGVSMLLFPQWVFHNIGGVMITVSPEYSRYSGAWFIGIAVAAFMILQNRHAPGPFFDMCIIGGGLAMLALLADLFGGNAVGDAWFTWAAIVNAALIAGLSWMSR